MIKQHPFIMFGILLTILVYSNWLLIFVGPTPWGIIYKENQGDWLQWFGTLISGFIGGLFTFLGVKITIDNEKVKSNYENKKLVLPLIKIKESEYDYRWTYLQFDFIFTQERKKDLQDTAHVTIKIRNVGERIIQSIYWRFLFNLF